MRRKAAGKVRLGPAPSFLPSLVASRRKEEACSDLLVSDLGDVRVTPFRRMGSVISTVSFDSHRCKFRVHLQHHHHPSPVVQYCRTPTLHHHHLIAPPQYVQRPRDFAPVSRFQSSHLTAATLRAFAMQPCPTPVTCVPDVYDGADPSLAAGPS